MLVVCAPSVELRKAVVKTGWMSASVGNDRRVAAVAHKFSSPFAVHGWSAIDRVQGNSSTNRPYEFPFRPRGHQRLTANCKPPTQRRTVNREPRTVNLLYKHHNRPWTEGVPGSEHLLLLPWFADVGG